MFKAKYMLVGSCITKLKNICSCLGWGRERRSREEALAHMLMQKILDTRACLYTGDSTLGVEGICNLN